VEKTYHIAEKRDSQSLADFLVKNGQGLLPMVELIEQSQKAVDDLIEVAGRATIEAVLKLSAQGIEGPPHPVFLASRRVRQECWRYAWAQASRRRESRPTPSRFGFDRISEPSSIFLRLAMRTAE